MLLMVICFEVGTFGGVKACNETVRPTSKILISSVYRFRFFMMVYEAYYSIRWVNCRGDVDAITA